MAESSFTPLKTSLSSVPAKALNYPLRQILATTLDTKQARLSKNGILRDYRGLAQLMGLEPCVVEKFSSCDNPTMKILQTWETQPDATLDKLLGFLEEMELYDVVNEITPLLVFFILEKNVDEYTKQQKLHENPVQVPGGPMDDLRSGESKIYDAYVSYAEEDRAYIDKIADYLESEIGLKLFIPGRDKLAGCEELDTNIESVKNRCRRMLVLLTPNFKESPACEFLISFSDSLSFEQKQRVLIPVILAPCQIPTLLNRMSKIDLSRPHVEDWMWKRLITLLLPADDLNGLKDLAPPPKMIP